MGQTPEGAPIVQIPLRWSNVYLVKSRTPILVDTGTLGDMNDLTAALADNGVRARDIGLVVVTHAHADHAGLAAELRQRCGAQIVLGVGDASLAHEGHNDELKSTGFLGDLAKPLIPQIFPSFVPDRTVAAPEAMSLAPYGIDGRIVAMPGHTAGSLVVLLANKSAFVGDQMKGGELGGALFPHSPGEHYYQADPNRNRENIRSLVQAGIETFYLGHGGPVSRDDVIKGLPL